MTDLGPASTARDIIDHLRSMLDERNIDGMARFGIETGTALGISNAELRPLARRIKRDHQRALALWESDIREARLLAAFTDEPKEVTVEQARRWASGFNSWEIVDTVSDLYCDAGLQFALIAEFARDEREFVRRTAFAMMAWSAVHMKKAPDAAILDWLPLIEEHATDPRNFVKKAVNWALRQIGKRNTACHGPALVLAERLSVSGDKSARWIGKDGVRELADPKTMARLKP